MSRIAKNSIKFTKETTCSYENGLLLVKGKLGELSLNLNPLYTLEIKDDELFVVPKNEKDKKNPICAYFVKDISRQCEQIDYGSVW